RTAVTAVNPAMTTAIAAIWRRSGSPGISRSLAARHSPLEASARTGTASLAARGLASGPHQSAPFRTRPHRTGLDRDHGGMGADPERAYVGRPAGMVLLPVRSSRQAS